MVEDKRLSKYLLKVKSDKEIFTRVYTYLYPKIIKYIKYKYGTIVCTEDVAHSFFTKLLEIDLTKRIEYPKAWAFTSCANIAKNIMKQDIKFVSIEECEILINDNNINNVDETDSFMRLIKSLDKSTQNIFYLVYCLDLEFHAIAEMLNENYECVRKKFYRGKKKLKNILKSVPKTGF